MNLLDLIFPKFCVNCKKMGDYLCPNCFTHLSMDVSSICLVCTKPSYDGLTHPGCQSKNNIEGSFTGVVFNITAKKLVHAIKYKPYLRDLAEFLTEILYESLIQNEEFDRIKNKNLILVPIPLNNNKFKKRGYNQAEVLANKLGEKLNFKVLNLLERTRDTKSQVGLNKIERKLNIEGAFEINKKYSSEIKNKNIILVDDILTTGATFSEATKILKKNGAGKIWAIAFAKED